MKATIRFKTFPGHKGIPGHQGGSLPEGEGSDTELLPEGVPQISVSTTRSLANTAARIDALFSRLRRGSNIITMTEVKMLRDANHAVMVHKRTGVVTVDGFKKFRLAK